MKEPEFAFDIVRHIATLSESGAYSRELNTVSFNGRPARLDVRAWRQDGDAKVPLKGIQLTDAEAKALCAALGEYFNGEGQECRL